MAGEGAEDLPRFGADLLLLPGDVGDDVAEEVEGATPGCPAPEAA
jgi:hypothetical protein